MIRKCFLILGLLVASTLSLHASEVTVSVIADGDDYDISAQVTDGLDDSSGIAGFSILLTDLPVNSSSVVFNENVLGDPSTFTGWAAPFVPTTSTPDRYSVGGLQTVITAGLGNPLFDVGEQAVSSGPINLDANAFLGTITLPDSSPALTESNFTFEFSLFPNGWSSGTPTIGVQDVIVNFDDGTGGGPEWTDADSNVLPTDGTGTVDLTPAWNDFSDFIADALNVAGATIQSAQYTDNPFGIFQDPVIGGNDDQIGLGIDRPNASAVPFDTYEGMLEVVTDQGTFNFVVTATVPEPSTYAMLGLAVVGFVGYARRRK